MRVLGLGTEGDGGAAIVEDGRILAAVNEERLVRLKLVEGFPRRALAEVLRLTATSPEDLSAVLVASVRDRFVDELRPFDGWVEKLERAGGLSGFLKRRCGPVAVWRDRLPVLERIYYGLQAPAFRHRRRSIRRLLREEFGLRCPVLFVDHHLGHVASAYWTSGFDDALVVSLDGGGDGSSGVVYGVRDGRFRELHRISAYHSLGNYYAYVTHLLGFKAMKHEGKVTGLAAHGEPRYRELFRAFVDERDGTIVNRGRVVFLDAIRVLGERLPAGWRPEDVAASLQSHFEDVVCRFVSHWRARFGAADVALAGGVFANVRVNQCVHELEGVNRVFVHPGMTDGGLAVGAALAACLPGVLEPRMEGRREPLETVFLGPDLSRAEIDLALRTAGLAPEVSDARAGALEEAVAERLAAGCVVARAAGRMEYGPRALGNRSILYRPDDRSVNDWLNRRLRRTEFMPFAPAVLYEERDRCFHGTGGAEHSAEFMTMTFRCTTWMRDRMQGVVHVDGTARPQLVRADANPGLYRILDAYRRRTGFPGLINTSFNMHEEPIVCSAADCVRAFLAGNLDYLAIGPYLVRHPRVERPVGQPASASVLR